MPSGEKRVFLSYTQDNADFAKALRQAMSRRGASLFDVETLPPGTDLFEALRAEIERASALVMLIPPHDGRNRNNVFFEAGAAKALGKRVLAVLPPHRPIARDELPIEIADVVVLDAGERPLESIADMLVQAVPESAALATAPGE